jgi:hypothetical protein
MYAPGKELRAILEKAARDYLWLLDRGYSGSAALKLVCDRFQLPREERMLLFRGIAPSKASAARRHLVTDRARGRPLLVDGHNQALAVMHYLEGRPVFLASDGLVRDAGGSHGRVARPELLERALVLLAERVATAAPSSTLAYFDAPIPRSAGHAEAFRRALAASGLEVEVRLAANPDLALKLAPPGSLVATSDSAIADALAARPAEECLGLFDAARAAIEGLRAEVRGDAVETGWLDLGQLVSAT